MAVQQFQYKQNALQSDCDYYMTMLAAETSCLFQHFSPSVLRRTGSYSYNLDGRLSHTHGEKCILFGRGHSRDKVDQTKNAARAPRSNDGSGYLSAGRRNFETKRRCHSSRRFAGNLNFQDSEHGYGIQATKAGNACRVFPRPTNTTCGESRGCGRPRP